MHMPRAASSCEVHPAGADRSHQPVLAADQILAVSAAGPGHPRRLSPSDDDEAVIVDEHVDRVRHRRPSGPGRHSGLHHQREARVCDGRRVSGQGCLRRAGRPARHLASGRGRRARGRDLPGSRRADVSAVPRRLPSRATRCAATSPRPAGPWSACRRSGAI